MTINELREALYDRRLPIISERTGVSTSTLRNIREGRNTNPTNATMVVLTQYFKEQAKKYE